MPSSLWISPTTMPSGWAARSVRMMRRRGSVPSAANILAYLVTSLCSDGRTDLIGSIILELQKYRKASIGGTGSRFLVVSFVELIPSHCAATSCPTKIGYVGGGQFWSFLEFTSPDRERYFCELQSQPSPR